MNNIRRTWPLVAVCAAVLVLLLAFALWPRPAASPPEAPTASATAATAPPPSPSITPSRTPAPTSTPQIFAARIPIIEYHHSTYRWGDSMMTTEWFEEQMDWLAENGYHTLTAAELTAFLDGGDIPAKSVAITFDIGTAHRDDYLQVIMPLLRRHGFHALVFVVTNMISDTCGESNLVCWDDLRAWEEEGLVSVESHGVYHPDYTDLSAEAQRWDAQTSKTIIEEKIGRPVDGFGFPYDSYNESALRVVESAGYHFALAGNTRPDLAVAQSDPDRFHLPRVYPYSNPQIYPSLYEIGHRTFGQLVEDHSSSMTTPSATQTAEPRKPSATASPSLDPDRYYLDCLQADAIADPMERLFALGQMAFSSDLSREAQTQLDSPVIIRPSCNILPGNQPRAVVLHATRGEREPSLSEFQRPASTSVHYLIDRDGQVYQLVPEGLGAYHVSCGGQRANCIASCPICEDADGAFREPYLQSVGIELVNLGQMADPSGFTGLLYEDYLMAFGYRYWEDFPEAQLEALRILTDDIRARYDIPCEMILGHYRINEKTDPGPALNFFWFRNGDPPRPPVFTCAGP